MRSVNQTLIEDKPHQVAMLGRGTIPVPDTTKRARIVHQLVGPTSSLHLRHVPTDWLIVTTGRGVDLVASVEQLRRAAVRRGYVVEEGFTVEDWNPIVAGMMRS